MRKMLITAPVEGKNPVSTLSHELFQVQAFPYLLSKGKFDCNTPQVTPISPTRDCN